jgi:hypothetical protein
VPDARHIRCRKWKGLHERPLYKTRVGGSSHARAEIDQGARQFRTRITHTHIVSRGYQGKGFESDVAAKLFARNDEPAAARSERVRCANPYRQNARPEARRTRTRLRVWQRLALLPVFFVGIALVALFVVPLLLEPPSCRVCGSTSTHFH